MAEGVSGNGEQFASVHDNSKQTDMYCHLCVKKCHTHGLWGVTEASGRVTVHMIEGSAHRLKIG